MRYECYPIDTVQNFKNKIQSSPALTNKLIFYKVNLALQIKNEDFI